VVAATDSMPGDVGSQQNKPQARDLEWPPWRCLGLSLAIASLLHDSAAHLNGLLHRCGEVLRGKPEKHL